MNGLAAQVEAMSEDVLARCQDAIGYQFRDPSLLAAALTHASVAPSRLQSNERMEFFGDAVLGLVVCQHLYDHFPDFLEGELTKIKSTVVSRKTCAEVAEAIGLPRFLILGNGIANRSKLPPSISAAAFEALVAALYFDAGLEWTGAWIVRHLAPHLEQAVASEHQSNFKSQLQQHVQKVSGETPVYELLDEKGPDHAKCFEVAVSISGRRFRSAWGPSKKDAEQKAAYQALVEMHLLPEEAAAT